MSYEIKQEGFEYRNIKLGQKCIYKGKETIVIGFDVGTQEFFIDDKKYFIMVKEPSQNICGASTTAYDSIILEGCEKSGYDWVSEYDLTFVFEVDDSLPAEISPVHVADILEDLLGMEISTEEDVYKIGDIIRLCIKSLRQHN